MSRRVIKPSVENGFSIDMLRLKNGEIVHRGPNNWHDRKIYCRFCGIWARYALVDTIYIISKNGTTISSGSMCKSPVCAERCREDTQKYRRNFVFEQALLNIEERLSLLTVAAAACHKAEPVQKNSIAHILTIPMNTRHISSFLSTNRDNNQYIHDYKRVDADAEKYRERCTFLMQKRVNREKRSPLLVLVAAYHKKTLVLNKIALLLNTMGTKCSYGRHNRIIASFLSEVV